MKAFLVWLILGIATVLVTAIIVTSLILIGKIIK